MTNYYLPADDLGKSRFITNYAAKLPKYAVALHIDVPTLVQVSADATNFSLGINEATSFQTFSKTITRFKNFLRDGTANGGPIGDSPQPPDKVAYSLPMLGNIFGRLAMQVQAIKANPNYTQAMAADLGIVGAEQPPTDPTTLQPVLGHNLQAGRPNITWKKAGHQGLHIYIDRGDGKGFGAMPFTDTKPDYLDEYPLPAANQTVLWKYKAMYIDDDVEVGNMSNELSVMVAGIY